jgi:histidinol-phosphate phosphatase family protein
MDRAVFLDRDGTINEDIGYLHSLDRLEIFPRAYDALRALQKRYSLFIVTNQPGVGKKAFSESRLIELNRQIENILLGEGIRIRKTYYCPHLKEDKCVCRKPSDHFLREAEREFRVDLKRSVVMGDHPHDMEMAKRAGAMSAYLLTGHGEKHRNELTSKVRPDLIARDIYEATMWIMDRCK